MMDYYKAKGEELLIVDDAPKVLLVQNSLSWCYWLVDKRRFVDAARVAVRNPIKVPNENEKSIPYVKFQTSTLELLVIFSQVSRRWARSCLFLSLL